MEIESELRSRLLDQIELELHRSLATTDARLAPDVVSALAAAVSDGALRAALETARSEVAVEIAKLTSASEAAVESAREQVWDEIDAAASALRDATAALDDERTDSAITAATERAKAFRSAAKELSKTIDGFTEYPGFLGGGPPVVRREALELTVEELEARAATATDEARSVRKAADARLRSRATEAKKAERERERVRTRREREAQRAAKKAATRPASTGRGSRTSQPAPAARPTESQRHEPPR